MENRCSADDADQVVNDSSRDGIQEGGFAEEFSSDVPSMTILWSAPSGSSSPYASLQVPSASKDDDHDVAHDGSVSANIKLEHALPSEPIRPPALPKVDSLKTPPVVSATDDYAAPGAFPVSSSRNSASRRTVRSYPISLWDSTRDFTNEESKQDDGVPAKLCTSIWRCPRQQSRRCSKRFVYCGNTNDTGWKRGGNNDVCRGRIRHNEMIPTTVVSMDFWVRSCWRGGCTGCTSCSNNVRRYQFLIDVPTPAPTSLTPDLNACNFLLVPDVTVSINYRPWLLR